MAASIDGESLPSLLDLITRVDNLPLDFATNHTPYYKFLLLPDSRPHGFIHPSTVSRLPWPSSFTIDHASASVSLAAPTAAAANSALQAAVDAALGVAVTDPTIFPMLGMHSEHFRIPGIRPDAYPDTITPLLRVERFAASLFGINTRGAHLTAYVRDPATGAVADIWVARRSAALRTFPGMLDSTVAGGVKADDTPLECVLAESDEEARLPPAIVIPRLRATGVVTLANRNPRTELVHGELLYVYDLDLSPPPGADAAAFGLVPLPGDDDEVDEFVLMSWQEVLRLMRAGDFKPNVCPVMIDFFIRHGLVTPETDERYVEICNRLRRKLPVPTNGFEI